MRMKETKNSFHQPPNLGIKVRVSATSGFHFLRHFPCQESSLSVSFREAKSRIFAKVLPSLFAFFAACFDGTNEASQRL